MDLVLLAAGAGQRFGGKKLFADIKGVKLYKHMANIYERAYDFDTKVIVSGEREILDYYESLGFVTVCNNRPELGKSLSIILALKTLVKFGSKEVMFGVCDQPLLKCETIQRIIEAFEKSDKSIAGIRCKDKLGNPCVFSSKWYEKLLNLSKDEGGKKVIKKHIDEVLFINIEDENELSDIDTKENYLSVMQELTDSEMM